MQLPSSSHERDRLRTRRASVAPPRRQRVAIVGGGLSGLCAAYELSRTPELRARFEVTVYSPGWRLGGKLASGRNPARAMRNEEHGLHVWFGFYDNAFRLAREVYERWDAPEGCPFRSVWDILTPHGYTPFGVETAGGIERWDFQFARNAAVPGDSDAWAPHEILSAIVGGLRAHLGNVWGARGTKRREDGSRARGLFERTPGKPPRSIAALDRRLRRLAERLSTTLRSVQGNPHDRRVKRLRRAIRVLQRGAIPALRAIANRRPELVNLVNLIDMFAAFVDGLLDPTYGVLIDFDLDRLNHLELRQWLVRHGADVEMVRDWALIRVAYDATFQFLGGDPERPNFEAGTAARFLMRAMLCYRNAAAFLVNGGMGEAFISPLYEVLLEQGVRFELFHALRTLDIDAGGQRVRSLIFDRQARVKHGAYQPLVTHGGLRCWLTEPDWSQLEGGDAMREAGVTFESRFGPRPRNETRVLHDGLDFDEVVLALPAGALRGTPEGPSCIEPLLQHRPQLRAMADGMNLVPSIAAQLWCGPTTEGLGWDAPRPAMVCWAQPLAVWADMSPVLQHEGWGAGGPRSTHYLCGAWHTDLHRAPSRPAVLREASAAAHDAAREQFEAHGAALWPAAKTEHGCFDWNVLHDPEGRRGAGRLEAQYVCANIEPSDLCDGASVGTSSLRPEAHESGLSNVVLAGTWTRTNINSTCVEAATISGLAAARVLTGDERPIFSEFFMQRPRAVVVRDHQRREESTWKVM